MLLLFRIFNLKSWRRYKKKVYKSIDELPLWNWFRIQETNELKYLFKENVSKWEFFIFQLAEVWENLYNEFINTFGISDSLREVLQIKKEIAVMRYKMVADDSNAYLQTFINIKEYELKQILGRLEKQEFTSAKVYIEKYMGFRIDLKTTSVKEYYEYLKVLEKEAKKITNG